MNKSDIVARVAERMGVNMSRAERAVDTVFEAIAEGLAKEENVRIAGFGIFRTRSRAARMGRHPKTGESVPVPASKSASFKASKRLRETVKRGWQEEAAEPADDGDREPRDAGAMLEMSDWPGGIEPVWTLLEPESMEATEQYRTGKALREGDVWELHLLHRLIDLAGLIEGRAVLCQLTPLEREMLQPGRRGDLQALLFRHLFWHADLSRFVETSPRGLPGRWPQDDFGLILWGLSNVAGEWQNS